MSLGGQGIDSQLRRSNVTVRSPRGVRVSGPASVDCFSVTGSATVPVALRYSDQKLPYFEFESLLRDVGANCRRESLRQYLGYTKHWTSITTILSRRTCPPSRNMCISNLSRALWSRGLIASKYGQKGRHLPTKLFFWLESNLQITTGIPYQYLNSDTMT